MADGHGLRHHGLRRLTAVLALLCGGASAASCRGELRSQAISPPPILRIGAGPLSATNPGEGMREFSGLLSVEGLVRTGEDGRVQPWLAEKWTSESDGKVLRFHLRPGVKFHNGTPLNARLVASLLPSAVRG